MLSTFLCFQSTFRLCYIYIYLFLFEQYKQDGRYIFFLCLTILIDPKNINNSSRYANATF